MSRLRTKIYRGLLLVYPPSYRRDYEQPMMQMVVDLLREDARGLGAGRLWLHLFADLFRSAFVEHGRVLSEWVRVRPQRAWGALLAIGALIGAVAAGSLAATTAQGSAVGRSSLWFTAAYAMILVGFLGVFLVRRKKGSGLLLAGVVLTTVAHLPVITYEFALSTGRTFPARAAEASGFLIMAGVGLVGMGMKETSQWSRVASRSTLVVLLYPLTLVFGYTALVNAVGGAQLTADFLFRGGYFLSWVVLGLAVIRQKAPQSAAERK